MSRYLPLILFLLTLPVFAQSTAPVVESTLTPAKAAPGEAVTFRVTVLVPTFMPKPIEFPGFDQPNLSITTPERSSVAISKRIDGDNWSGVMRDYRVQALAPGTYKLGGDSVKVTYMDPGSNTPVEVDLPIASANLTVSVPPEAVGLKPFIGANDVTLEQTIDGDSEGIRAGDSFSRTVTATITGSTARQLPRLLGNSAPDGVAAYPQTPEAEDKGDTGIRKEKVTYVAEEPADGKLPALRIRWYDLDDQQVKTAELEEVPVSVKGPLPLSHVSLAQWLYLLAGIALAVFALQKWGCPWIEMHRQRYLQRKAESNTTALEELKKACSTRDYTTLTLAAARWREIGGDPDQQLQNGLLAIGASRFSQHSENGDTAWRKMEEIISHMEKGKSTTVNALPPLNPRRLLTKRYDL